MNLFEYLVAKSMGSSEKDDLTAGVKKFINDVFSSSFALELNKVFDTVKIDEKNRRDDAVAMAYGSKKILINPHKFYSLSKSEQMAFIVHELIHIAQNKGNYKLRELSKRLWRFYNTNRLPGVDISKVMVGKSNVSSKWINKNETINYLLTEKVRFEYMKPGSQDEFRRILSDSGLFNLNSLFWKKRI